MLRDYRLFLDDILEAIERINTYCLGLDEKGFQSDLKTQDAVIRNLEIIGEAAAKLPDNIKAKSTDIEWRKIIGIRNILIHEYFGISLPIVWDVVQNKLKPLERAVRGLSELSAD
jgi:uncharacterized protein with HEPN domain